MKKEVKVKRNYPSSHEFGEITLHHFSFSYKESNNWLVVITKRNSEEAPRNT